jgi:hypothetical protein
MYIVIVSLQAVLYVYIDIHVVSAHYNIYMPSPNAVRELKKIFAWSLLVCVHSTKVLL